MKTVGGISMKKRQRKNQKYLRLQRSSLSTSSPEMEFLNKGARNRVGIGFSYRPAGLHKLVELVPWNSWAP
jgi:hypothetical protein